MYDFGTIYEAFTVEEAIRLKTEHPDAIYVAGGSDVFVMMRSGWKPETDAISIYLIDEMRGVSMDEDGTIRIGALTSFSHIAKDELICKYVPVLGEAVDKVGGPQVRNIGTIGGNVCHAHTGADSAATLFALDAEVEVAGPDGSRILPVKDFYKKDGTGVTLEGSELLRAVLIPKSAYEGYYGAHWKYGARNAMDVDVIGCSTNVMLSEDKTEIRKLRLCFGAMGATPIRAAKAEEMAPGMPVNKETVAVLADAALEGLSPRTDIRGTKELRVHVSHVAARRTLIDAMIRAGAEMETETPDWAQGPLTSEMGEEPAEHHCNCH